MHVPELGADEAGYVLSAMRSGYISGSAGTYIDEFERRFAHFCACEHGIAVTSGSTALHLAAALAGIGPGDEVLVSALTNIATANAVAQLGGIVIPIDCDPWTWNLDVNQLAERVTAKTKAIIAVHHYGHPVDMDPVLDFAAERGLFVIEDAAEAHGAIYKGAPVGSLSDIGCFSFYANKVITTGEGGMLTTNNPALAARARKLRNLAFQNPRFVHEEIGYNYRMTNVQAAIGCGQMNRILGIVDDKRHLAQRYIKRLGSLPGLKLPHEAPWAKSVYWMFGVVVGQEFPLNRDALRSALHDEGIETRTFFCPMNLQPGLLRAGLVKPLACPVAESLWHHGLYLPSNHKMTDEEFDHVCMTIEALA